MEIFILKSDGVSQGQRFGPYSSDQVKKSFEDGDFTEDDLAFFEGCDGWVPITNITGVGPEYDEASDDPEVDQERQRELAEMFPDPEDDFFNEDEEDEEETELQPDPISSGPPPSSDSAAPPAESSQSAPAPQPKSEESLQPSSKSATEAIAKSSEKPLAEGRGGQGKRISLSKAQAAMRERKGARRGKQRGGIPLPRRPGIGSFGWVIFLSLLYGIGVAMIPEPRVIPGIPAFSQVFGKLHPILVHFPIGALLLALPMHLCDRPGLFRHVGVGSTFVLWFAMLTSVFAIFTGYFSSYTAVAAGDMERDLDILNLHVTTSVLLGSGVCASLFLKLFSRRFGEAWLHHLCSSVLLATVLALLYSMHTGTLLTHGKDYLDEPIEEPVEEPSDKPLEQPLEPDPPPGNSTTP